MKSRRTVLAAMAVGVPGVALAATTPAVENAIAPAKATARAGGLRTSRNFPQVQVQDQDGKEFTFYDDLVKDKIVLISFASIDGEKHYPIIDNLVKVQEMVGDRLGKDVFMYTVTTKPETDTPAGLKEYAKKKGARWQFLSGEPAAIREILSSFNVMGSIHGRSWVGNDKTNRWMGKVSRVHPIFIAEAVARVSTGAQHKPYLIDMHSYKI